MKDNKRLEEKIKKIAGLWKRLFKKEDEYFLKIQKAKKDGNNRFGEK
jgi:hypothetical protein